MRDLRAACYPKGIKSISPGLRGGPSGLDRATLGNRPTKILLPLLAKRGEGRGEESVVREMILAGLLVWMKLHTLMASELQPPE